MHKYAYVHGDPIQGVDPSGLYNLASVGTAMSVISIVLFNANYANAPSSADELLYNDNGGGNLLYEIPTGLIGFGFGKYVLAPLLRRSGQAITRIFRGSPSRIAGTLADELRHFPLSKNITSISDDTIVHFANNAHGLVEPGVGGKIFSYRYGDIKHLSPAKIETLIGDLAAGGQTGAARIMHVLEAPIDEFTQVVGNGGFTEYISRTAKTAVEGWIIQ